MNFTMPFLLNVLLALAWAAITGVLTLANLLVGYFISLAVIWITYRNSPRQTYFIKIGSLIRFTIHFAVEMFVATIRVALDVITPEHRMTPAILAIPLKTESASETTTLANVITLTPGTLALDVSADGKTLFVHSMYAKDLEAARREIVDGFAARVREVYS